ncbi:hypothetical protein OSTOST_06992 [Ostertagia ostertagi]
MRITEDRRLQQWAKEARIALFGQTFYYKIFSLTAPAIERVYMSHQQSRRNSGLHVAADGPYDSRGFSAKIRKSLGCRFFKRNWSCTVKCCIGRSAVSLSTLSAAHYHHLSYRRPQLENRNRRFEASVALIMHARFSHKLPHDRQEQKLPRRTAGSGAGTWYLNRALFRWMASYQVVRKRIAKGTRQTIPIYRESRGSERDAIRGRIEKTKTHLWDCIERGISGEDVRHRFNGCLMHVRDVHNWEESLANFKMPLPVALRLALMVLSNLHGRKPFS